MARPPSGQPGSPPQLTPQSQLRATQIIYLGLIIGLLLFSGVTTFLALRAGSTPPGSPPVVPSSKGPVLLAMLPFVSIASVLGAALLPIFIRKQAHQRWLGRTDDEQALVQALQAYHAAGILKAAALEGAGLMGAMTVLIEGNLWALAAPAAMILLLLVTFPKTSDLQRWLDHVTGGDA